MKLLAVDGTFAICKLDAKAILPPWAMQGKFFSITRTHDELSIVCEQSLLPSSIKAERNWKALKVEGPLDFSLTGILASIANPLAVSEISIFAISTFDTDYVLVKETDYLKACQILKVSG